MEMEMEERWRWMEVAMATEAGWQGGWVSVRQIEKVPPIYARRLSKMVGGATFLYTAGRARVRHARHARPPSGIARASHGPHSLSRSCLDC
jgi:hypothetical protein